MKSLPLTQLLLTLLMAGACYAKDLGTYGPTWPIAEDDLLKVMMERLHNMEKKGELKQLNQKMQDYTKKAVLYPKPLQGLQEATSTKTWYHDPSIVLTSDFKDNKGVVFAKKGQRINPLHQVSWGKPIVLFDATSPKQLAFVRANFKEAKWVLTSGSPIELGRLENKPVFFDQAGKLTEHFHIKTIPTIIAQDGTTLKLTTYNIGEKQWK
jgi:conjugal transfer pilus assembly protein TraW